MDRDLAVLLAEEDRVEHAADASVAGVVAAPQADPFAAVPDGLRGVM